MTINTITISNTLSNFPCQVNDTHVFIDLIIHTTTSFDILCDVLYNYLENSPQRAVIENYFAVRSPGLSN